MMARLVSTFEAVFSCELAHMPVLSVKSRLAGSFSWGNTILAHVSGPVDSKIFIFLWFLLHGLELSSLWQLMSGLPALQRKAAEENMKALKY